MTTPSTKIGSSADVVFVSFGNAKTEGKVDTGATTSSLHAENISINGNKVTFRSSCLSNNSVTLDLVEIQEVRSANHDGDRRPIVKLDVTVSGKSIPNAEFNLRDRSNMDAKVLIGQNILKLGDFVIDVNLPVVSPVVSEAAPEEKEIPKALEISQRLQKVLAEIYDITESIKEMTEKP